MNRESKIVRAYQPDDESAVVGVWYRSGKAAHAYLPAWQTLTVDRAVEVFRSVIRDRCEIWVGVHDDQVAAYLAMNGSYIDRMYVDPNEWRQGWGERLTAHAKGVSPQGLELHTHQENHPARRFYERQGFRTVKFGSSPPPECAPDVEYHWRPANK